MAPVPNNVLSDMLTSNRRLEGRAILSMRKVVPAAEVPAAGDVCLWATAPPTDVQGTRQNSELTEARFFRPKSCDFDLTFHFCKQKRCSSKNSATNSSGASIKICPTGRASQTIAHGRA